MDLNRKLSDGERILGEGKTIRGFVGGVITGTVAGGVVTYFYLLPFFPDAKMQFIGVFVLSFGALLGDAIGSFIKRRAKIGSGKPFMLDSVLFVIIALVLVYPFVNAKILYTPVNVSFFILLTLILHPLTNFFANRAGLKNVPW
jgi:CDP-2,3-bis-(O-geranylgeranyl)-sn-glycerol synthase